MASSVDIKKRSNLESDLSLCVRDFGQLHSASIEAHGKPVADIKEHTSLPDFFTRRLPPTNLNQKRLVDNEEIMLMSILEEDGKISLHSNLTLLILLMTRVTKMDHRVLLQRVVGSSLTKTIAQQFVLFGGLRILKRWMRSAEEEGCIDELRSLVKLCRDLPFDSKAVKDTEIGKSMKRLLKYKGGNSHASLKLLYDDVRGLMAYWTDLVKMGAYIAGSGASTGAAMAAVSSTPNKPSSDTKPSSKKQEHKIERNVVATSVSNQHGTQNMGSDPSGGSKRVSTPNSPAVAAESYALDFTSFKALVSSTQSSSGSLGTESSSVPETVLPLPVATITRQRRASNIDMAEGAQKLLKLRAQQQQEQQELDGGFHSVSGKQITPSSSSQQTSESSFSGGALRKGGLKRRSADSSDGGTKRAKLSITWADEKGGSLREVQFIEVEKIKSSVAEYQKHKSHRELVKKERQLEKEAHVHHITDAMQSNTEWRRPAPLKFSLQVKDLRDENPLVSQERDIQTKRLAHVLEVRYLDDSLIPSDPDHVLPEVSGPGLSVGTPPAEVLIPWATEGGVEEEYFDSVAPENTYASHSGMDQNQSMRSSGSLAGNWSAGFPAPMGGNSANLSWLPPTLHRLNAELLRELVNDPNLLKSLLGPHGQVDEEKVRALEVRHSAGARFGSSESDSNAKRPRRRWGGMADISASDAYGGMSFSLDQSAAAAASTWGEPSNATGGGAANNRIVAPSLSDLIALNSSLFSNDGENGRGGNSSMALLNQSIAGGGAQVENSRTGGIGYSSGRTGSKAGIPCKFFNTRGGCKSGDVCPFGHFSAASNVGVDISAGSRSRFGPGTSGPSDPW